MVEFFVGMLVFFGIAFILYIVGKLTLPLLDWESETNILIIIIGGILGLSITSSMVMLCYSCYLLGNEILNK